MPIYEVQYTEQLYKDMTATLATLINFVQQLLIKTKYDNYKIPFKQRK